PPARPATTSAHPPPDHSHTGNEPAPKAFLINKQRTVRAVKVLVEILKDELGINAAFDCISTGDMGACGETILNIAGSFAGGVAGKILTKYGAPWGWGKAGRLVKRVIGLVDDIVGGAMGMLNASKKITKAKEAMAKAKSALAAAKRRAAEAGSGACSTAKKHSFLPKTKVLLANDKTKLIKDIKLGDKIIATDPKTGKTTVREVVRTITTEDDKHFVDLTIHTKHVVGQKVDGKREATGAKARANSSTLTSTINHPFWSPSEKRWIEAGELKPGVALRTAAGGSATLTATREFEQRQRTHDLTIRDIHTYYVLAGAIPALVHNCGDIDKDYDVAGGHAKEHVGLSDQELIDRAPALMGGKASSLTPETAQGSIDSVISGVNLNEWATKNSHGAERTLTGRFNSPIGRGVDSSGNESDAYNLQLLIRRVNKGTDGHKGTWIVHTVMSW
ncbi:polymorphic toxin-type HINT domain-containing protein, partial [Streptomyces californicus]|uniref:polymorphic toxin-type HINT domain-containing protein n=1 Tax=Streptomyces californicus TaxID=67351 RepID=UPI0037A50CA8